MNAFTYTLMTYGLTAVISYAVIGIVVMVDKSMNKKKGKAE